MSIKRFTIGYLDRNRKIKSKTFEIEFTTKEKYDLEINKARKYLTNKGFVPFDVFHESNI